MLTFVSSLGILLILLAIFLPLSTTVNMPVFKSDISFGLAEVPIGIMLMILCGLCTSVMWGNIFNLAVEGLGKYTAAASGIFMVMVCGGGVLPLIQGAVADGFWLPGQFLGDYRRSGLHPVLRPSRFQKREQGHSGRIIPLSGDI